MSAPIPAQNKPRQWNHTQQPPPPEDTGTVTVILEGLFSICYLDRDPDQWQCQLGVFNQDAKHKLKIIVNGGNCSDGVTRYEYTHAQVKQLAREKFRIEIEGSNPDVAFFQRDEVFNRANSNVDQDFRWLVDVETPDLYSGETTSKQPHYGPKILVKNGVFFTSRLARNNGTKLNFDFVEKRKGPGVVQQLGPVARETAARIVLGEGQRLNFEFLNPAGVLKTCVFESGQAAATIVLQNLCWEQDGTRCIQSDFHHHFGSFTPPGGKNKFDLVRRGTSPTSPASPPTTASDEAPCHSMGYGNSGGGTQP